MAECTDVHFSLTYVWYGIVWYCVVLYSIVWHGLGIMVWQVKRAQGRSFDSRTDSSRVAMIYVQYIQYSTVHQVYGFYIIYVSVYNKNTYIIHNA